MRGSTAASETLGAQEIKNQWGTLRLKRSQKAVMRYVRESLRIMAEIAVKKFSPETLRQMTGLPYPTGAEKSEAQQLLQLAQQQAAASGMPPEAMMQAAQQDPQLQQAMRTAGEASWDEILQLLQNDLVRAYRIDIETNSTIDAEATEDKQNIVELITAMSQFLQGVGPLVESGTMPFDVAKQILLSIVRRFRFGSDVEDSLKQMQAPAPKEDPKIAAAKMQAENDKRKADMEMQAAQQELEQKKQLAQMEMQVKQFDLKVKEMELQLKAQEQQLKLRGIQVKGQLDEQKMQRDAQFQEQQHALNMQGAVETHTLKMQQQKEAAKAKPAANGKPVKA
jgi:hypothetical protein